MLVTDRHRTHPLPLLESVKQAVMAGVDCVQLREKDLDTDQLRDLAIGLRQITRGRCLLIVNSSLDVAATSEADGLHLPENGIAVATVRRSAPEDFLVGKSAHSASAAFDAQRDGASYVELGTVFATDSKPGMQPAGLDLVRRATRDLHIPCLAIGGIHARNAGSVLAAGADGIAVVSAILQADNIAVAVAELRRAMAMSKTA